MTELTLKLVKQGNSSVICFPKTVLQQVGISSTGKVDVKVTSDQITIKPAKKGKMLDKLLEEYDRSQPYPMEIVNKGGTVGEELS